jgi:hypothetical protein
MKTFLAVVLALVVGFALGSVFGSGTDAARVPLARASEDSANEASADIGRREPPADLASAPVADARTAAQGSSSGVAPAAVARALAAAPEVAAPIVSGEITGFVRDESGAPIAGVEVRVVANTPRRLDVVDVSNVGHGLAPPQTIDEALASAAKRWVERQGDEVRTRTDASGAFRLPALGGAEGGHVQAGLAGHLVEALDERYEVFAGDHVELVARRLARLTLDVVDADGRALDRAVIERKNAIERFVEWRRGAPLLLEPKHTTLRAHQGVVPALEWDVVDSLAISEWGTLDMSGGGDHTLRLVIVPRTRLFGVVTNPEGHVLTEYTRIVAAPRAADEEGDLAALRASREDSATRRGRFAFLDLVPGEWTLAAEGAGDAFVGITHVRIESGALEANLVVEDVPLDGILVVRVVRRDGSVVRDFSLDALRPGGDGFDLWNFAQDARGAALVRITDLAEGAADPRSALDGLMLTAETHDGYAGRAVATAGAQEVVIELDPPGRLVVAVAGLVGTPFENVVEVELQQLLDYDPVNPNPNGRFNSRLWGVRPMAGVWTFPEVSVGHYRVVLKRGRAGRGKQPELLFAEEIVEVTAGERRVDFTLPSVTTVRVFAPELVEGAQMSLVRVHESKVSSALTPALVTQVAEGGVATFPEVVAGRYRLSASDAEGVIEIDVPTSDVTFDLPTWDAMRVSITDTNGTLAGLGLREGDLVVGMVGQPRFSLRMFQSRLYGATSASGTPFGVTVRRGSESFDVDLTPIHANADWRMRLGGYFRGVRAP